MGGKRCSKDINRHLQKRRFKCTTKISASLVVGEMQIKTIRRSFYSKDLQEVKRAGPDIQPYEHGKIADSLGGQIASILQYLLRVTHAHAIRQQYSVEIIVPEINDLYMRMSEAAFFCVVKKKKVENSLLS